ncbi:hypothetical protein N7G274_003904 [Stereocaulon virgatum]|uniref:HIT domain-containing protein n=1 Tax=Stereocaulon virgatum TaxID=373712 RepID=A0ABR4ACM8_9LECA
MLSSIAKSSCPFCAIATSNPPSSFPSSPHSFSSPPPTPNSTTSTTLPISPIAHIILSTPHILAFLDHAPISRGHVLVVVRNHREKLGDVSTLEGASVGRWLGIISRAVVGSVREEWYKGDEGEARGEEEEEEEEGKVEVDVGDWNVVQNNGARAAQVVPHVHFHIIPRVGDVPEVKARSWTIFGKGQREDLDEQDAEVLVKRMRIRLGEEVEKVRRKEGVEAVKAMFGEDGHEGLAKSKL